MSTFLYTWNDTIVALATPQGIGAIGVIRLSGKKAIDIVNELFPTKNLLQQPTHTLHVGTIQHQEKIIDEVVISIYKSPKSYTGENIVEISCHGSPYIQQQIINACIEKGARTAKAGEFTQRAFLNGKLDLTQAEAVADIITSNTIASQQTALHNIRGGFSKILKKLREELIQFSALIELEVDFSQEDIEFADKKKFYTLLDTTQKTVQSLLQSFQLGNVIKNGITVAIVGKPNVGKSTLLNVLLNEERAIVSDIAGTTRDTIEETININGILFRFIDTAGIRDARDEIEAIGITRSLEKISTANIVLYLFDLNSTSLIELKNDLEKYVQQKVNLILCGTKQDLGKQENIEKWNKELNMIQSKFSYFTFITISAKTNINIDLLKHKLTEKYLTKDDLQNQTIITNVRHYESLQKLLSALQDIQNGLYNNITSDLLALDIRSALHYLGEITGEITNEDQLDYIFSKFCIGK